ncbi:MAG TPA: exopolysaccharide biosynthesis polyprenyl glycosylphosphotransferase [Gaiellaceae bacterium]|nr:exopolysaccharide biosynthesis polyprenyl glycosylphosphotransferase [Gaiellaceae bacterium]
MPIKRQMPMRDTSRETPFGQSTARAFRAPVRRRLGVGVSRALLDLAALLVACAVVPAAFSATDVSFIGWSAVFVALVMIQFAARGTYAARLRVEVLEDIRLVVPATAVAAMMTLTAQVLVISSPTTTRIATLWASAVLYVLAGRAGSRIAALRGGRSRKGMPTLIIGAGRVGQVVAERLLARPAIGLLPIGFLDKEPLLPDGLPVPVLGASWDLERLIDLHGIRNVIITFSTAPTEVVLSIVRRCEELGVTVSSVPRLYEAINGKLVLEHLGGLPLMTKRPVDSNGFQFSCKYAADRIVATLLTLLLLPLLIAVAISVRISLGSPVLFRQVRVGKDGKHFEMLKFRSMREGGSSSIELDLLDGARGPGGVEGEDRRTWTGKMIRRTSVDELPQLFNVIRGEMSLVGPRPERPALVEIFERKVYRYGDRHRVKVGITGWAQIHGLRGKTSLQDRVEWDNYYIENWSPWLDLKTMLLTAAALFRGD